MKYNLKYFQIKAILSFFQYLDEKEEDNKFITCGLSDDEIKKQVESEQKKYSKKVDHQNEDLMYKYTKEANMKFSSRNKRQTASQVQLPFPNSNSVCGLYLIADPFYYNQIYNNEGQKVT